MFAHLSIRCLSLMGGTEITMDQTGNGFPPFPVMAE